jgi:hypothetical protein
MSQTTSLGIGNGVDILIFDEGFEAGLNLNLSINYAINQLLEIEFRPGVSIASNFIGFYFGGYLKIFPIEVPVYLIVGLKLHSNIGESRNGVGVRDELYYLPAIGLGYKIRAQKTLVIFELLYQKPYPNGLTWSYIANQYSYSNDFNGVIGLNFGFSWEL